MLGSCWVLCGGFARNNPKLVPSGIIWKPSGGIWAHVLAMLGPFWGHVAPKLAQVDALLSHLGSFWEPAELILEGLFENRVFDVCLSPLCSLFGSILDRLQTLSHYRARARMRFRIFGEFIVLERFCVDVEASLATCYHNVGVCFSTFV